MFNKIKAFIKQYLIIVISIILIIFFWLAEYTLHYFIVSRDTSLSKWFIMDPMELHMRVLVTLILMAFGLFIHILTLRKKSAEMVANKNQIRYQGLFSSMLNGFALHRIIVDESGRPVDYEFLEINDAFERMTGLARKDIIGRRVSAVMPELKNDSYDWVGTYGRVALNNEKQQFEQYSKPLSKWYNISAYSPSRGEFATVIEDISERKKIENLIMESQERMEVIFSSIQAGIVVVDRETHNITYVNQLAAKMIGAPQDSIMDRPCHKFICPAEVGACPITDKSQKIDNSERILLTVDGRRIPIIKTVIETELIGRRVLVESFVDISERKMAEQILQEKRDTLLAITDSAQDAIIMMDSDGKISFWNPAAENILGYSVNEALGKNLHQLITPEKYLAGHVRAFPEFQRTGKGSAVGKNIELQAIRKDGKEIEVELSLSAVKIGPNWNAVGLIRDITERKQAEKDLQFRNILMSTQQEASIDGILVVDEDTNIISYNQRFVEMWGIPLEVIEKKSDRLLLEFVTNRLADPQAFLQRVQYLYEHKHETSQDEVVLKDGCVFDRYSASMVGSEERYYGRVWYFHDITERKRQEKETRDQALFFETLIDTIMNPVFYKDTEGKYLGCNKAFEELLGVTKKQIIGKTVFDLNPAEIAGKNREMDVQLIKEGGIQTYEYPIQSAKQGLREIQFNKAIFKDARGDVKGIVGVMMDITDRTATMREIEKVSRQIKLILDSVGEGIYGLDNQGKTIFINPAGAKLLGYQPEEILGKVQHELTHHTKPDGSSYKISDCPIHASFKDGNVHHVTGEIFWRKDGNSFPVEYISTPIAEEGKNNGSVVVFRDVAERKQAETMQAAVYKISEISSSADNLLELYAGIHMIIDELMSTANFYIAMYNEKENLLDFPYFVDERDPSPGSRKLKNGLTEYVIKNKRSLLAPPIVQKKLAKNGEVEIVGTPSIDWMGVPLNIGKTILGALVVQSYCEEVRFGAKELAILNFISDNIAAAILRKKSEDERKKLIKELQASLDNIKTLKGLVPICSSCKKIRNDKGYWQQVEEYVSEHTEADFSHGICDECAHRLYPQYFKDKKNKTKGDEVG